MDSEKLGWNDEVREVLKHGTLSVGFIGLAETLAALYGKHHGESEEMQQKGLEIVGRMRKFLDERSAERGMNYTLLALLLLALHNFAKLVISSQFLKRQLSHYLHYSSLPVM